MAVQCDRHYTIRGNGTVVFGEYESIPKTFVLNLIAWPVLLLLFSLLRKLAWDYGRIALVNRDEERWMSLFFGERPSAGRRPRSASSIESLDRTMKRQDNKGFCSWLPAFFRLKDEHIRRKCGNDAVQYLQFQRYLIWYSVVICFISLGVILPINFMGRQYEAGNFARTTISNLQAGDPQLWIHFLLSIVYLVLALVFMRHFSKNLQFYEDEQASRTLMVTGVPTRRSICELTMLIHKHFRRAYGRLTGAEKVRLVDVQFAFDIRRLLQLDQRRTRAKLALLNMDLLKQHADPDPDPDSSIDSQYRLAVLDGESNTLTDDHSRLRDDDRPPDVHARSDSRVCSSTNGCECAPATVTNGNSRRECIRPTLHPYVCGQLLCYSSLASLPCCRCCAEVDAEAFYRNEVEHYTRECAAEQRRALTRPCGILFLTFESAQQAQSVLVDFRRTNLLAAPTPRVSSCASDLSVTRWNVEYSPEPNNIFWENLAVSKMVWWLKAVLINLAVFIVAFLCTTPSFVVNELRRVDLDTRLALAFERDVSFFVEFVHLLIIVLFCSLLPYFVYYTNQFVGNWTRTTAHLVVMYKSYIFLVLMILVLPSIGFTSALLLVLAFFRSVFIEKTTDAFNQNWRCIFEPSNGAFFVRYVMTAGFIGTTLELLRFADLFLFTVRMFAARSIAERATIRKSVIDEFEFGRNYAHQLCVFAVIVAYSIPVPLVTPCGVIYIALRYAVDRHNLYFAYKPSRIDKHIHTSAINFFMSSLILLQLNVVFYLTTKSSASNSDNQVSSPFPSASSPGITQLTSSGTNSHDDLAWQVLQVSAIGTFLVTLIVYCGCSMFDWFKNVSPIVYTSRQSSRPAAASDPDLSTSTSNTCKNDTVSDANGANAGWKRFCEEGQNGVHSQFTVDSDSDRSHSAIPVSTDRLVDARDNPAHSRPQAASEGERNVHTENGNLLRVSLRRRGTAYRPSILLERYDELPLTHGETCDCQLPAKRGSTNREARRTSASNTGTRDRIALARQTEEPKDTRVLIHVSVGDTTGEPAEAEKHLPDESGKKSDRMCRSISLSPQSRAGYETIEMRDYDDELDQVKADASRDARRDGVKTKQKRCSFDLSSSVTRSSGNSDVVTNTSEQSNAEREKACVPHVRAKTGPVAETQSSAKNSASDKRVRANTTVSRSPLTGSSNLCPQITVTAPTPVRQRSVEVLPRAADLSENAREAAMATVSESNSAHNADGDVTDRLLHNENENGNDNDTDESNVDDETEATTSAESALQYSNAQHNLAYS